MAAGCAHLIKHVIPLEQVPSLNQWQFIGMYRMSPVEGMEVEQQVTDSLMKQLIEPSKVHLLTR